MALLDGLAWRTAWRVRFYSGLKDGSWKQNLAVPSQADRDGISFLWVAVVVSEIQRRKSPQAMRAAVEALPRTMAAAYDLLIRDMDQMDRAAMLFVSLAPRLANRGRAGKCRCCLVQGCRNRRPLGFLAKQFP